MPSARKEALIAARAARGDSPSRQKRLDREEATLGQKKGVADLGMSPDEFEEIVNRVRGGSVVEGGDVFDNSDAAAATDGEAERARLLEGLNSIPGTLSLSHRHKPRHR